MESSNQNVDPVMLSQFTTCYNYSKIIGTMFTGFMYIFLIIFPWVIEIILITQQIPQHQIITLTVCGSIQTIISIFGGFKMGMDSKVNCCSKKTGKDSCEDIWCGCPTNYRSLFSGGYVLYFLPQWIVANMIISWTLLNHSVVFPLYTHIMIYMPILMYTPFLFIGCAYSKSIEDGYIEIK